MKKIITIGFIISFSFSLVGQITYTGCNGVLNPPGPHVLNQSGTTNDGGTIRNNYTGSSGSCSAGNCTYRIIWSVATSRWEIQLSTNGGSSFPNVLYISTISSQPNPPSLTFGMWSSPSGCGSMTQLEGDVQSTLPVELTTFKEIVSKIGVQLSWQTASELNNEKFEIEESQDGRELKKIGEVTGNGTTLEQQEYLFEVKNPRYGISYYRLKQIDFDGQFEYSKVISVDFKGENGDVGEFYPNPSKSAWVNLDYFAQNDDEITVSVFDMTGKLVVNQFQQISSGNNNLSFDFSDLNTGIYIVKIGDERNPIHRKLIIER